MKSYRKKAQSLSINTIIIAVLGLAILVLLFAIVTGRIGIFNEGLNDAGKMNCASFCSSSGYSKGSVATDQQIASADCATPPQVYLSTGAKNGCCCTR